MKLGEMQTLRVEKKVEFGVYLAEQAMGNSGGPSKKQDHVLLPQKQVPDGCKVGDLLEVFLYRDSKDRPIATTAKPKVVLGEMALLAVRETGKIGAFLDWGLEKDLFLPFKEMTRRVEAGDEVLIRCYLDKSERLCASMKGLYHLMHTNPPYQIGDEVQGRIYEFSRDFGTYAAVEDRYSAMIPRHESTAHLKIGDVVALRVTGVKEDGKLDVTLREKAYIQMDEDARSIWELLDSYAGVLPFTEKASPEVILRETGLSKAAFKRALGKLYKERKIDLSQGKIRKISNE